MDELQTTRIHPLDYLRILRRRKAWFIVPFSVAILTGVIVSIVLPRWYRSSATLAISGPQVSPDLARPAIALDQEEKVRALEQQLLSSSTLQQVGHDTRILSGPATEAFVSEMRRRIEVTPAKPVGPVDPSQVGVFLVSYSDHSPELAHRVADRLSRVFIVETAKSREQRAEGTASFLAANLAASQQRLATLESQLSEQKQQNMGSLPEQLSANLSIVSGLRQQLESTATALRGEQDRLTYVDGQIETMKAEAAKEPTTARPGDVPISPGEKIASLEQQLAQARVLYTDKHPEIQRLEDELAAARRETSSAPRRLALVESSPAYRQLVADREQERLRIQGLRQSQDRLNGQIALYQARVEEAPIVEQQMAALVRDYKLEQDQYNTLSEKYKAASLAEDLEHTNVTAQFKLLYPASMPREPYEPNLQRILLLSIAGGLVLGIGFALLREFLDRSVHDARALQQTLSLPVLGEIPRIQRVA